MTRLKLVKFKFFKLFIDEAHVLEVKCVYVDRLGLKIK